MGLGGFNEGVGRRGERPGRMGRGILVGWEKGMGGLGGGRM